MTCKAARRTLGAAVARKRAAQTPPDSGGLRQWTMLTRSYCHLCDDMRDALLPLIEGQGIEVGEIDVDADPRLESVYGERVPVLFAGAIEEGQEICALRLDRTRVMAALAATRR